MVTAVRKKKGSEAIRPDEGKKRKAIVDAARALFTGKGYETTTMAEVARSAGTAVGTVYLYFKNKNDLLYAVRASWEDEFLEILSRPELLAVPHHLRTRPLIEACFALCEQHTDMIQLMGLQPEMVGWHDQDSGKAEQAVKAFFDDAKAAGAFRDIDTHAASVVAYGMVEYALRQCFEVEGGRDPQRYIDVLVDAFEQWLLAPELREATSTAEGRQPKKKATHR
jgi:AcrR family transcriptional regulator